MKDRKILNIKTQAEDVLSNKTLSKYLLDALPFPAVIINKERVLIYANKKAEKIDVLTGTHCWDTFGKQASISENDKIKFHQKNEILAKEIKCTFCMANKALKTQIITKKVTKIGETLLEIFWIPIDENAFLHYGIEITEK